MKSKNLDREPVTRLLAFDPTPAGLVTKSLRKEFKYLWSCIRKEHFKENDLSCEICKTVESENRLIHGHEVYSFSNSSYVKLEKVAFLCTKCHDTIHFERTRNHCQEPYLRKLVEHYCLVNGGLSESDFDQDYTDTFHKMRKIRDNYGGPGSSPDLDYGPFKEKVDIAVARRKKRAIQNQDKIDDDDYDDFEMFPDHECQHDIKMGKFP